MLDGGTTTSEYGPEGLGPIPAHRLTPEHRRAMEAFRATRRMEIFGPFIPLLWSPEAMVRAAALGEYLREGSAFPPGLSEFIILIAARHWTQQYEWSLPLPIAVRAGVEPEVAGAIAEGRRPPRMSPEQETLYDFCTELV